MTATATIPRARRGGPDEFLTLCEAVRRHCGIDLAQYKRGQMERRVRSFAERRGTPSLEAYAARLTAEPDELDAFLDRVTINVSQLWRNPDQWRHLERVVLPELAGTGRIRAWSAGCSYGAEAYTLAALAHAVAPAARTQVLGTDIDARVVERARAGRFDAADARDAPAAALKRAFVKTDGGGWEAGPEVRRLVRFEQGDLLRLRPRPAAYDLVLCRNTVIYFTEEVRDALHARLAASVRPGGYLVVGATERITSPREIGLEPTVPFTYRRVEEVR